MAIQEESMISAAEHVFKRNGYENTKMTEIAQTGGFSKVTIYSHFESKENLFMAVTYRAMNLLVSTSDQTIKRNSNQNGLDIFMALTENYIDFCIDQVYYMDLILNYLSIVRDSIAGKEMNRLSKSLQNSIYYKKCRSIQNVVIELNLHQIERGMRDGSILFPDTPELLHHMMWSMVTGYAKVNYCPKEESFIGANNIKWRNLLLNTIEALCLNKVNTQ